MSLPAVAGCGGGEGSTSTASTHAKVKIADFAYEPTPIEVEAGGTVTWTDSDAASHTVTADDQKAFDTGTIDTGKSKTVTFKRPGTYTYFCRFHAFMHGTVTVL